MDFWLNVAQVSQEYFVFPAIFVFVVIVSIIRLNYTKPAKSLNNKLLQLIQELEAVMTRRGSIKLLR